MSLPFSNIGIIRYAWAQVIAIDPTLGAPGVRWVACPLRVSEEVEICSSALGELYREHGVLGGWDWIDSVQLVTYTPMSRDLKFVSSRVAS
jgi:hypothetical protein